MRWDHPRLGFLSPDQFIPAAEHTGVIRQLTIYVVRNALAQCRAWRDAGLDLRRVGEPVRLGTSSTPTSSRTSGEAIETAGVPPSVLTLELTESTVMGESHRSKVVLDGLQALGVRLSVDDFGTGYSSLTHLRSLPVTELKIDKSFVMTMTVNDQDAVIVRTLVELGRSLGLRTVAEGVESADAQALLRELRLRRGAGLPVQPAGPGRAVHRLARPAERAPDRPRRPRSCASPRRSAAAVGDDDAGAEPSTSDERPGVAAAGLVDREAARRARAPGRGRAPRRARTGRAARPSGSGSSSAASASTAARIGSGTGSPPNSQITVRSLNSWWNIRPWSMPRMRPSSPSRQWPLLRSVLLPTRSKAHIAPQLVVVRLVLVEREVVLLEVGVDEQLHRPDAERPVAAGS